MACQQSQTGQLSECLAELTQCHESGLLSTEEYTGLRRKMIRKTIQFAGEADLEAELLEETATKVAKFNGFSSEEAMRHADAEQMAAMARTPKAVLADLQKGNARFWTGEAARPEKSAFERRALMSKQFPCVALVSCADSRVPVEIVFDQGLGDIFTVRVAGNCVGTSAMASLQYAVHHLKVKVIVVMGHESCGAVKAACAPLADLDKHPEELSKLLKMVREGLDADRVGLIRDDRARDREAVTSNVQHQIARLAQDKGIMEKVKNEEVLVVGAFYEISSGIVDFFGELTEKTSQKEVDTLRRMSANPADFHLHIAQLAGKSGVTEDSPQAQQRRSGSTSSRSTEGTSTTAGEGGESPSVKLPNLLTSAHRSTEEQPEGGCDIAKAFGSPSKPAADAPLTPQVPSSPKPEDKAPIKRPHRIAAMTTN